MSVRLSVIVSGRWDGDGVSVCAMVVCEVGNGGRLVSVWVEEGVV